MCEYLAAVTCSQNTVAVWKQKQWIRFGEGWAGPFTPTELSGRGEMSGQKGR